MTTHAGRLLYLVREYADARAEGAKARTIRDSLPPTSDEFNRLHTIVQKRNAEAEALYAQIEAAATKAES